MKPGAKRNPKHRCQNSLLIRKKHDHITPILIELHWLPVTQRIKFKVLLLIHKCLNNTSAPKYLTDLISTVTPSRTRRSMDSRLLNVPFARHEYFKNRAFGVAGPSLWNTLPFNLRHIISICDFKTNLKTYLFKQHFSI